MSAFKYILLDLDGTVINSAPGITNSVKYALVKSGAPVPPYEVLRGFIGPPLEDGFCEICGFDRQKAQKAVKYYREYYSKTGIFECSVYKGVPELLSSLYSAGKCLILATSKPEIYAGRILEHFSLKKYFCFIAGATLDNKRSSKSDVIAYAVEKNGIADKRAAVMIGDRHHDIDGAKNNGISSVGVLYGFGNRAELEAAGADYISETPEALLELLLQQTKNI